MMMKKKKIITTGFPNTILFNSLKSVLNHLLYLTEVFLMFFGYQLSYFIASTVASQTFHLLYKKGIIVQKKV